MKIRPLGNRILVKRHDADEKTESGIFLMGSGKEKPWKGSVIAVGPGEYDNGERTVLELKKGDVVYFKKYVGTEINTTGEHYLLLNYNDIIALSE